MHSESHAPCESEFRPTTSVSQPVSSLFLNTAKLVGISFPAHKKTCDWFTLSIPQFHPPYPLTPQQLPPIHTLYRAVHTTYMCKCGDNLTHPVCDSSWINPSKPNIHHSDPKHKKHRFINWSYKRSLHCRPVAVRYSPKQAASAKKKPNRHFLRALKFAP